MEKKFDHMLAVNSLTSLMTQIGKNILEMKRQWSLMRIEEKEGFWDVVSAADKAVEETLVSNLRGEYPDHGIESEEGSLIRSSSDWNWIIDPIDGTANFVSGMDFFGISLGLKYRNKPYFGIITYPALGKTLWAVKRGGAFLNGVRLNTKPFQGKLSEAVINGDILREDVDCYPRILRHCRNVLVSGSYTIATLHLVEEGVASLFHNGATQFDVAAAIVIAWEAGCVVSGIWDDEIDLRKKRIPIIMSRGQYIHDELRGLLCREIISNDEGATSRERSLNEKRRLCGS